MTFILGVIVGVAIGAMSRGRSLNAIKDDAKQLLGGVSPEARDAADRVETQINHRFHQAQEAFLTTREATRRRLQRELETERGARG
jgi:hypothetical protein